MAHLDLLMQNDTANEYSQTLWNGTAYKERDDVYMIYNSLGASKEQFGPLTAGNGFAAPDRMGPELMFGWTLGDALNDDDNTILLIKTAWGGRDLAIDFRPPSSEVGNHATASNPNPDYGWQYRGMMDDLDSILANLGAAGAYNVPGYSEEAGYSLEGFVWFQGWNDLIVQAKVDEYAFNLANFIRDVRLDLGAPNLPFGTFVVIDFDSPVALALNVQITGSHPRRLSSSHWRIGPAWIRPFQFHTRAIGAHSGNAGCATRCHSFG